MSVTKRNILIGFIIVTLMATGVIYLNLEGSNVRMRIDNDKSVFYTLDEITNRWVISGTEYNSLFSGNTKLNRAASKITLEYFYLDESGDWLNLSDTDLSTLPASDIKVIRTTPYIRGPVIIDTYYFDGRASKVELFPIKHEVNILNGTGYIYQYEVRDLVYDGPTIKDVLSPMSFGRNMKVEWDDSNYWSTVYASGILKVRYRPDSDNVTYNVRLFDPLVITYNLTNQYRYGYVYGKYSDNYYENKELIVGITTGDDYQSFIFFDIAELLAYPINSSSANLTLRYNSRYGLGTGESINVNVKYVYENWSLPRRLNYDHKPSSSYLSVATDTITFTSANSTGEWYSFNITAALQYFITKNISRVGLWLDTTQTCSDGTCTIRLDSNSAYLSIWLNLSTVDPTINSSRVFPSLAYHTDTLNGYCTANTSLSIPYTAIYYMWFKNGSLNTSGSIAGNFDGGKEYLVNTLGSSLKVGDQWIFSCMASDDIQNSSWINSSVVPVSNASLSDLNLSVAGFYKDITAELGDIMLIATANSHEVCIDIIGDDNGTNISCGVNTSLYNFNPSLFPSSIQLNLESGNKTLFYDTFTDSNKLVSTHTPNIGTGWSDSFSYGTGSAAGYINSSGLAANTTGTSRGFISTITNSLVYPDYSISAKVSTLDNSDDTFTLVVRWLNSSNTYGWTSSGSTGEYNNYLFKIVGGSKSVLNNSCGNIAVNNILKLEVNGSTISAYKNGSLVCNASDTSLTEIGTAGIGLGAFYNPTHDLDLQRWDDVTVEYTNYDVVQFVSTNSNVSTIFNGSYGDIVSNLTFELNTDKISGYDPTNIKVYLNNTLVQSIYSLDGSLTTFSDLKTSSKIVSNTTTSLIKNISLDKKAIVTSGSFNITGLPEFNQSDRSVFPINITNCTTGYSSITSNDTHIFVLCGNEDLPLNTPVIRSYYKNGTRYKDYNISMEWGFSGTYRLCTTDSCKKNHGIVYVDSESLYVVRKDSREQYHIYYTNLTTNTTVNITTLDSFVSAPRGITYKSPYFYLVQDLPGNDIYQLVDLLWNFTGSHYYAIYQNLSNITNANYGISYYNGYTYIGDSDRFIIRFNSSNKQEQNYILDRGTNFTYDKFTISNNTLYMMLSNGSIEVSEFNYYPLNPRIDVGILDGIYEYSYYGNLNTSATTDDISEALNTYLSVCIPDSNNACNVPVYFIFDTNPSYPTGSVSINISNLTISVDTTESKKVIINGSLIDAYYSAYKNSTVPITFSSSTKGILYPTNVIYNPIGSTSSLTILAHLPDYSQNVSRTVLFYNSAYSATLPNKIYQMDFYPSRPTSKNVVPFGQTSSVPFYNITSYNYGGKNSNLSIYIENTTSPIINCVNLTISNTSLKSGGSVLPINSWYYLKTNISSETNFGLWFWADYNCTPDNFVVWSPEVYLRMCAEDVDYCSEELI